jgi:hypothetical protein
VNEHPVQMSQPTEGQDMSVHIYSSSGHEDTGHSPHAHLHSVLSTGQPTARIDFSVFPKSGDTSSSKQPFSGFNLKFKKTQNHSNSGGSISEGTPSEKANGTLQKVIEKYPDGTEGNILPPTGSAVIIGTPNCDERERSNEIANGGDRQGSASNSNIVVDVVPRQIETLSVSSAKPCPSAVTSERSLNSCVEHGIDAEGTTQNNIDGNSTRNLACAYDKASCEVVQPIFTQASSGPPAMTAAARRVKFRNSVNKPITASFLSDALPSTADSRANRSTPTPPLSRALSAPSQKPGKGILVHRIKSNSSVDICADVTDGEPETVMSAPARRRVRTPGPRRKARSRCDESSGDEAEAGPRQKQKISAGRRGLLRGAEIVTMVSLVSDGSDAEGEPTGGFLHRAPWLQERHSPAQHNQREQAVCPTKLTKSGKCCAQKTSKRGWGWG